jgi:hypothetical protein
MSHFNYAEPPQQLDTGILYKTLKYNNITIKYTADHVLYNSLYIPLKLKCIHKAHSMYLQDYNDTIYKTNNFQDFEYIGAGQIIGCIENYLIYQENSKIHIHNGISTLTPVFYLDQGILLYTNNEIPRDSAAISHAIVYKRFAVFTHDRIILYVSFDNEKDVQYKLAHKINSIQKISIDNIEFLEVETEKSRHIYYYEKLIQIISDSEFKELAHNSFQLGMCEIDKKVLKYLGNDKKRALVSNAATKIENAYLEIELHRFKTIDKYIRKYEDSKYQEYFQSLKNLSLQNHFYENPCSVFDKKSKAFKFCKDLKTLLLSSKIAALENDQSNIKCKIENSPVKKSKIAIENKSNKNSGKSQLDIFLSRKYSRIFKYNEKIWDSTNLAYLIIKKESEDLGSRCKNKRSTYKKILGDSRLDEVLAIMLEISTTIEQDLNDVENIRQRAFLKRALAGVGTFILGNTSSHRHIIPLKRPSIIVKPGVTESSCAITVNSSSIEDKLSDDFIFFKSACTHAFFIQPDPFSSLTCQLGKLFGYSVLNGLNDDDTQKYIRILEKTEDSRSKHILMILSTRQTRSMYLNNIFVTYLHKNLLELKKAAIVSLAIYNFNSKDNNIYHHLLKECDKHGPLDLEKNHQFYDRDYRILASFSLVLVSDKNDRVELQDSFCALIINGMSSIGKGINKAYLDRNDFCREDEIFYSALFKLTVDFKMCPETILEKIKIEGASKEQICRMAAEIFYVSLKILYDANSIGKKMKNQELVENQLYNLIETLEDRNEPIFQILFDNCLASLSIIKNATFDINLLRILRRQMLKTKELKNLTMDYFFDPAKKDRVTIYTPGYDSIQHYKVCIGFLCSGLGTSRVEPNYRLIILAFFPTNNPLLKFSFLDILKLLSAKAFTKNTEFCKLFEIQSTALNKKRKSKKMMNFFQEKFKKLSDLDKKFVIDILSDYYENYHFKTNKDSLFNITTLGKLLSICR